MEYGNDVTNELQHCVLHTNASMPVIIIHDYLQEDTSECNLSLLIIV